MILHVGTAIAVGGLVAAFLLPAACNPRNPRNPNKEGRPAPTVAAAAIPKDEANVNVVLEASAKQYVLDLYS